MKKGKTTSSSKAKVPPISNKLKKLIRDSKLENLQRAIETEKPDAIKNVCLGYCDVTDDDYDLQCFPKLEIFSFHANSLTTIVHMKVPSSLLSLSVGSNLIESIEPLQFLKLPLLRTMNLYTNKFITISALKKCHWPQIQIINLQDNNYTHDMYQTLSDLVLPAIQTSPKAHRLQFLLYSSSDKFFPTKKSRIKAKCSSKRTILQ